MTDQVGALEVGEYRKGQTEALELRSVRNRARSWLCGDHRRQHVGHLQRAEDLVARASERGTHIRVEVTAGAALHSLARRADTAAKVSDNGLFGDVHDP